MESFSLNSAKSFLGKKVNLHLKDGSVIVNVQLRGIKKAGTLAKGNQIEYAADQCNSISRVPLKSIAWAEQLNAFLMYPLN